MKRLLATLLLCVVSVLSFSGAAAALPDGSGCVTPPDFNVGAGLTRTLTVDNSTITTGAGSKVTVKGSNDCVEAGANAHITVTGNNDFVTAGASSTVVVSGTGDFLQFSNSKLTLTGSGNELNSLGNNSGNAGGNQCQLVATDNVKNCAVSPTVQKVGKHERA